MKDYPRLLISDKNHRIYDVPFEALGMKAGKFFRLKPEELIKLPDDSELFMLPDRIAVGFDREKNSIVEFNKDPYSNKNEKVYPVAAFVSPGYAITYNTAYKEGASARLLPLFSYSAVVFYKNTFYVTVVKVENERRQQLKGMNIDKVKQNFYKFKKKLPDNRLIDQIGTCALTYGCPAAKNFFLSRYEAPLPVSYTCNADCVGCISLQTDRKISETQPRIKFAPTPKEVSEIALKHINNVKDPVVSFGQGCEGDPLMAANVIFDALKEIRRRTKKGIINMNTNASRPYILKKLFKEGLSSIRVSLNSFNKEYYEAYYRPKDYSFNDVVQSIKEAKKDGVFVSINYLSMPGFTDSKKEVNALKRFLDKNYIDMIQWRNLNYDPVRYFDVLKTSINTEEMIGMNTVINSIKSEYPAIMHGYFNPSNSKIKRYAKKNRL